MIFKIFLILYSLGNISVFQLPKLIELKAGMSKNITLQTTVPIGCKSYQTNRTSGSTKCGLEVVMQDEVTTTANV